MAISARTVHTLTLPDGSEATLREATGDTLPVCNTCGAEASLHLFRPAIAYRCAPCLARWGKAPTVAIILTLADGTLAATDTRLAREGEAHVGPVAVIP
jgi:hypothetical protein